MIAVLMAVTVGAVALGSAVIARHRAQAAADLAALAAATVLPGGTPAACEEAAALAQAMAAVATACHTDGLDVVVVVEAPVALELWGMGPARAVARAGPAPTTTLK